MYFKVVNGAIEKEAKTILEEINMEIKEKDHIAIVGRNGAGKTTLLSALIDNSLFREGVGEEKFQISKVGRMEVGFLKQNISYTENDTLESYILDVYKDILEIEEKINELEKKISGGDALESDMVKYSELYSYYQNIGGYDYKKEYLTALTKNGFLEKDLSRKISSFSGGEQTKINFVRLLLSKPDLLLLDEPTNHLDIEAILWLEDYLKNYPKAFVLVSHDRTFINRVANKIYEIEYGMMDLYVGNYDYFLEEKSRRYYALVKSYERQQKEIQRLQRIVERFRYKPSKASMAMSKLHQIERMNLIDKPKKENTATFHVKFQDFVESGRTVMNINHLKYGYQNILGEVNLTIEKGRRIGIVGANGTGKSTFLKTIMGSVPCISGSVELGYHTKVAYFDQQFKSLNNNLTVYEEFSLSFPEMNELEKRFCLACFLFFEEDIHKKIEVLSGGEKVRLQLCKVIYSKANFLILDEPTNHLDIYSKEKLEEILRAYPGTILFVSHDRYFIKKLADAIIDFDDYNTYYDYGYEDYLEKRKEKELSTPVLEKVTMKKDKKKHINHSEALDKKIRELEKQIDEAKAKLFLEEVYSDPGKYRELEEEIERLEDELNACLIKWC